MPGQPGGWPRYLEGYLRSFQARHSRRALRCVNSGLTKGDYSGTEHMLLVLLELEDSGGVLSGLGIDKAAAQARLAASLAAIQAAHQAE